MLILHSTKVVIVSAIESLNHLFATQINMVAELHHLNNVFQIAQLQDFGLALSYDHKIRKTLSAEIARDPTICPNQAITNKN